MRKLAVVVPTLNERENIRPLVEALLDLEHRRQLPGDVALSVLVVDNDSPDGTGDIAEALAMQHPGRVSVLHLGGIGGLGTAYIGGFTRALEEGADLLIQMDADFSHPIERIPALVAESAHADMVLGSRYTSGGKTDESWPWYRELLSTFANSFYVRTALGIPLADATGGFRLWRRETLLGMDFTHRVRSQGYVFQVEMAYLAHRLGYRIHEIPITFSQRKAGTSKMSLGIQLEAAWRVLDIRRRYSRAGPGDRVAWSKDLVERVGLSRLAHPRRLPDELRGATLHASVASGAPERKSPPHTSDAPGERIEVGA